MFAKKGVEWVCVAALLGPGLGWAQSNNSPMEEEGGRLGDIRALVREETWPALTGFSPAKPLQGVAAPAGDHGHTQAFRSAEGCVVFFPPLGSDGIRDVSLKWLGPREACNGKPLNGVGELQIYRGVEGGGKVVGVLKGMFRHGMLSGKGSKANYSYDKSGKPESGTYYFEGEFANSVLHGEGARTWIQRPGDYPRVSKTEGRFQHGLAAGPVMQSMLQPFPGVAALQQRLIYAENGQIYIDQFQANGGKRPQGVMYFEDDPYPWKVSLDTWKDGKPVQGQFYRSNAALETTLLLECDGLVIEARQLRCTSRSGVATADRWGRTGVMIKGIFSVDLPVRSALASIRYQSPQETQVMLPTFKWADARCDSPLTRCTVGSGILPIQGTTAYWRGKLEWNQGTLLPVGASLFSQQGAANHFDPDGGDVYMATCSDLASPTECRRGEVSSAGYPGLREYQGGWRLAGVQFDKTETGSFSHYASGGSQWRVRPYGWAHIELDSGLKARARFGEDGQLVDVDTCSHPTVAVSHCEIRNSRIVAIQRQESRRPAAPGGDAPSAPVQRFQRTEIPQRTPYVLPGMR